MSDLKLDTQELRDLFRDLLSTSIAFSDIENLGNTAAEAVGHGGLGGRIHEFSNGWDDRRREIVIAVDTLWAAAQAVAQNFEDLDQQLKSSLNPTT